LGDTSIISYSYKTNLHFHQQKCPLSLLTVAEVRDAGKLVLWWERVPGTGIVIDIWFVGDGSEGVALAALSK